MEEQSEQLFEWESKYQDLETKYEQDLQKLEDSSSSYKKDLLKSREQQAELQKNYDILKKKYNEEVDSMRQA